MVTVPCSEQLQLNKYKRGCKATNTDKIYVESLANEYAPKDATKVVALKKLDRRAKLPATIFTYTFGIIAALSIVIVIIGFAGMGLNYPLYE